MQEKIRYFKELPYAHTQIDLDNAEYNIWFVLGDVLIEEYHSFQNGMVPRNEPFSDSDIECFGLEELTKEEYDGQRFLENV